MTDLERIQQSYTRGSQTINPALTEETSDAVKKGIIFTHTRQSALDELDRIFQELQTDFHDQWDWMEASFAVECVRAELDVKDEELAEAVAQRDEWKDRATKFEAHIKELREQIATARAQGREEGLREALEFVQRERLDNHEDAIACIAGVLETDISYSNAIRDAENVIISLIPRK